VDLPPRVARAAAKGVKVNEVGGTKDDWRKVNSAARHLRVLEAVGRVVETGRKGLRFVEEKEEAAEVVVSLQSVGRAKEAEDGFRAVAERLVG
jgi:hypothetical protein